MTNEEKAKEIGRMWYYDNAQPNNAAYRGAVQMGIWKDEQHAKEKQQLIDEAWDWLTNQKGERTKEDFVKAMKGE